MKTYNNLIGLIAVLAIIISCQKKEEKAEVGAAPVVATSDVPPLPITLLDGNSLQAKSITGSFILILFQTDCDHCQREAQEFQKNLAAFDNYTLYFISANEAPEIETFAKQYGLSGHDNVKFGTTRVEDIINYFGSISAPSVYIYNGSGKLIRNFNGETDIQQILEAI